MAHSLIGSSGLNYRLTWRDGRPTVRVAGFKSRKVWRAEYGQGVNSLLASGDTNAKLAKSGALVDTFGLSLLAADGAGLGNLCAMASVGCRGACLDHQGLGSFLESIVAYRAARTCLWYWAREWFLAQLKREILRKVESAAGAPLAFRLNVFSDIPWERHIGRLMSELQGAAEFYDYSKYPRRAGALLPNYWVTFSRSESNEKRALEVLRAGGNVAVVFAPGGTSNMVARGLHTHELPKTWRGFPVFNADTNDARWLDPRGRSRGRVAGLLLKSASWDDYHGAVDSGFAVPGAPRPVEELVAA